MNYPVIFLLFCWGAADSGVALPEPFPEARGPVYGCGVTPQGRSRGTRLSREWKNPGRLGTGTAEGKEGGQWLQDPFSRDSDMGRVRYQWSYRSGRLMKVPHALAAPNFCFSGRLPCAVDREELEDALEDTLIVAENPLPEEGRPCIFLYRGKVCHSLDEVGKNAGVLSILSECNRRGTGFRSGGIFWDNGFLCDERHVQRRSAAGSGGRHFPFRSPPGRDRCVHGGIGGCSRLLVHDAGLGGRKSPEQGEVFPASGPGNCS